MSTYLVTVKIPSRPDHDGRNKITGICPVDPRTVCSDVTGASHTLPIIDSRGEAEAIERVRDRMIERGYKPHITRVEQL